ncbi:unnamed protein product [Tuber aestivum]|uniref:Las1-domain-containing protein n=1 Tax=Tuber aestivum TaxID=59557 RepID=A0A292PRH7_9PEZI|nr:unnamed protein product [Tuber aestivum]
MSPTARLVPWRHPSDLHNLKSCLYPTSPSPSTTPDADPRHQAVQKVRAWGTRMRIPHSIESTAFLTQAILADTPLASQLSSRLCYASALCRYRLTSRSARNRLTFVNGLLDPAQTSTFALPMHTLAKTLGLPTSFVEIRHAATHEALPSLPLLRTATARALEWLWGNYWCSLSDPSSDLEPAEEGGVKARALLKSFRTLRRTEPARVLRSGDGREETKLAMGLIKECIYVAGDGLIDALLEEKALIPAGKHKSSAMKGAILLWTPLLDALDAAVPEFGDALLLAMLESLKHVTAGATSQQLEFAEAVMAWLVHLTTSNADAKSGFGRDPDAPVDLAGLAKQCVLYPSKWTMRLLRHLLKEHAALRGRYARLVGMAEAQVVLSQDLAFEIEERMKKGEWGTGGEEGDTQFAGKKRSIHDVEEEVRMFEARYEAMKRVRLSRNSEGTITTSIPEGDKEAVGEQEGGVAIGRWKKWSGKWVPRPIGVV